jgi:tRNA nucleotidyltransferase/poly(A) polymerase
MKSFKDFLNKKLNEQDENKEKGKNDWRKEFIKLEKGFVPPTKLRPIIQAFLDSGNISIMGDTSKEINMPKKSLFLVGGPVRDFLRGKSPKDFDLATNATPEQIALILHNAGFKVSDGGNYDRSGKNGSKMNLGFEPSIAKSGDNKLWYLKGRDNSEGKKPFVIGAVVDGEEFDIATFRKDAKVTDGQAEVDFVDNPAEDAARRDLTINALYIELNKSDGENTKLYDPTKQGWHDIIHGKVRTVGKASERFEEDKLRVMRAVRFHCKFGQGNTMDEEIEKSLDRFIDLKGVALERVREEFLKGLLDPEVDPKKYISIYKRIGLLNKVFPELSVNLNIPSKLRDKRDKSLTLAWILQNNSIESVSHVLSSKRTTTNGELNTGWSNQEKNAIIYLLTLKEFDIDNIDTFLDKRRGTGLSEDQIKDWVDLFDIMDENGNVKSSRPVWAKTIRTFADFKPDPTKLVTWHQKVDGDRTTAIHPEIIEKGYDKINPTDRGSIIQAMNKEKLKNMFGELLPKTQI